MEQRKSARRRSSDGTSNRNMRSINNSREVSRRAKGKNRYAYEEDRRSADIMMMRKILQRTTEKESSSNDKKKRRPEEDYQNVRKMSDPENNKNRKNKRRRRKKEKSGKQNDWNYTCNYPVYPVCSTCSECDAVQCTYFYLFPGTDRSAADPAWNYLADTDSGKRKRNWRKDILYTDLHHSGSGFFLYRKSK